MKIYLKRKHREIGVGRPAPVFSEEVEGGIAYYFEGTEAERQLMIPTGLLSDGPDPVEIAAAEESKASIDFSSAKRETADKPVEMPDEYFCRKHNKTHSKKQPAAYFACYETYAKSLHK